MSNPNDVLAEIEDALTSVNVAVDAVKKLSQEARAASVLSDDLDWCANRMVFYLSHMRDRAQHDADMYNRMADYIARSSFDKEV